MSEPTPPPAPITFPPGFRWGAATAAYQVEGAVAEGGRGPCIWDSFASQPGRIRDGSTARVAADHYHRYGEDVDLMRWLGLDSYRLSVSWPRIQPRGTGPANQRGLDFYRRLLDALLPAGITPVVTLYHWDLPQALQDRGGWENRDTAERFAEYAGLVAGALGDLVPLWTTVNEPWCAAFLGYGNGLHAPGIAHPRSALRAAHHLLLGHGLAAAALRSAGARAVSVVLNPEPVRPWRPDHAGDVDAARRIDGLRNRLTLDAVLRGRYPEDVIEDTRRFTDWDFVRPGDLDAIGQPVDLLGLNYYARSVVRAGGQAGPPAGPSAFPGCEDVEFVRPDGPVTSMDWPITPDGLRDMLVRIHDEYPPVPLVITENGAAFEDVVSGDGQVHDGGRVSYLDAHLRAAHAAIERGVDLRGFFVWSLIDNFEWAEGYSQRFGIIYVDFPTGQRIPKDSARWYRDVVRHRGLAAVPGGAGR